MTKISQFTAVPFIQERSEATPGLWNNIFSTISQNVDQLNSDLSVAAVSVGTAQVSGGISTNTLAVDSGRTLSINAPVLSLSNRSLEVPWGRVFVDGFGAKGDGVTDDTASIQSAENSRTAWQTLIFTPSKTYIVDSSWTNTPSETSKLLSFKTAGVWDFRGATIKYGSTQNLTTGSDGGGLGMINVLADNSTFLGGVLSLSSHAQFALAYKSQTSQHRMDLSIVSQGIEPTPSWAAFTTGASIDITGTSIGTNRATNISGNLIRPDCPILANDGSTVTAHQPVTAILFGGSQNYTNFTSKCLVLNNTQLNITTALLGVTGIMNAPAIQENNTHWTDFTCGDLGCAQMELYGTLPLASPSRGLSTGDVVGISMKGGAHASWYTFDDSTVNQPPGVDISATTATNNAFVKVRGQFLASDQSTTSPAFSFLSESSLGLFRSGVSTMAMSYGTFNLAKQSVRLSMRTIGASQSSLNMSVDEVLFSIQGASGASLAIRSGGTIWIFNSSVSTVG